MPSATDVLSILPPSPPGFFFDGQTLKLDLPSLDLGIGHLFGGQVFSQATIATQCWLQELAPSLQLHMLQGVFIKAGNPTDVVSFTVNPIGLGRTFQRFEIKAFQKNKLVFQALASAQKPEPAFLRHELAMPNAEDPSTLMSFAEFKADLTGKAPVLQFPIDIRVATPSVFKRLNCVGEKQGFWFRYDPIAEEREGLNAEQLRIQSQALLAYASDYGFLGAMFIPHEPIVRTKPFFLTSLDHTLWYYREYNPNEWTYFESDSPVAQHGRGLVTGRFFQHDRLLAVATQEGLLRRRD